MRLNFRSLGLIVGLLALGAGTVQGQDFVEDVEYELDFNFSKPMITSGDLCAPVNVGKANRVIQNTRGKIVNSSTTESIAVSCPITTTPSEVNTLFFVIQSDADGAKEARCVLREKSITNADVRTISQVLDLPRSGVLAFGNFEIILQDRFNGRLNMTCLMPPQSSLGAIQLWGFREVLR